MTMKTWNKILNIELIVGMLFSIGVGIVGENIPQLYWSRMCWITLAILAIIFALQIWGKSHHTVKRVGQWLSNLTLIFIFNFLIYTGVSTINLTNKSLVLVSSIVGLLLFLVVDIPTVVVNFPVVKNWFMRLFMVFLLYVNDIYNVNHFLGTTNEVKLILRSGVVDAIACFILTFFIAKAWNFRFSWNLKLIKTKHFQLVALAILIVISIWFAFFNSFITLAPSVTDLLCFWRWDLSTFEVTEKAVLMAINAGVFEETSRYLNLLVLLAVMHNFKGRVFAATVVSSLLFSLAHFCNLGMNIMTMQFDLEAVLQQMVYTFGAGMLFAVIYLYSGKLWLSMMIHGLLDLIGFSETPLTRITNPMITNGWVAAIIMLVIPLVISLVMLTGKRRKFMEDNAGRIIAAR